jgi:hypothetical protein
LKYRHEFVLARTLYHCGKVDAVRNQAPRREDVWGEWTYTSAHFILSIRKKLTVSVPTALIPGKEPPYLLNRRIGLGFSWEAEFDPRAAQTVTSSLSLNYTGSQEEARKELN